MMGVVQGGWEFVIAAYTVTALVLGGYAFSLHRRYRAERGRALRETARTGTTT
jgi:hypothetical protein